MAQKKQVDSMFKEFEQRIMQLEQKEIEKDQEILQLNQQLQENQQQIQQQDQKIYEQEKTIQLQKQQLQGKSANLLNSLDNIQQYELKIKDLEQVIIKYKLKPANFQGKNMPNFNNQEFESAIFQAQKVSQLQFTLSLSHKDIKIEEEGKKITAGDGKINALLNFKIDDYENQIIYFKIVFKFVKYLGIGVYQEENGAQKQYQQLSNNPKFSSSCWINDLTRLGAIQPQGQLDCNVNKEIELTIIYNGYQQSFSIFESNKYQQYLLIDAGKAKKDVNGTWRLGFELFNQGDYMKIVE